MSFFVKKFSYKKVRELFGGVFWVLLQEFANSCMGWEKKTFTKTWCFFERFFSWVKITLKYHDHVYNTTCVM